MMVKWENLIFYVPVARRFCRDFWGFGRAKIMCQSLKNLKFFEAHKSLLNRGSNPNLAVWNDFDPFEEVLTAYFVFFA